MSNFTASFTLKFNDASTRLAARAFQVLQRGMRDTEGATRTLAASATNNFRKMAQAREVLGIRSEQTIQREIRRTEAAYERLARTGATSARELARAQDQVRSRVSGLREELAGVNRQAGRTAGLLRGIGAAAAGLTAAKAVLSGPVGKTMSYDRSLANLSNTAYAGQSLAARRARMGTLNGAVVNAVQTGGGTRDSVMATLDRLVASGAFTDVGEATRLLPVLTKAGTAANVDPGELADIAIRAKQTFGLSDTSLALDQALKAGQLGGFELKDMAKWLPQQMAAARLSGLSGQSGFATLLAANQASVITAGTKDEAGNNLWDLLDKINSQATARDAARLGINLSGSLAAARSKGTNSLDAFVNLTDQIVGRDPHYKALRIKAANSKGAEQRATYESMGDILEGSAIGKMVQNRQALMALLGIMNNRKYMKNVHAQLGNAKGATNDAFDLISQTPSYKTEQLAAEKEIAMQVALDKVNPSLGDFAASLTSTMREWPGFSAAVVGATLALTALAAAAGAAALTNVLTGGASGGAGRILSKAGGAARALGPMAAAALPWVAGTAAAGYTGWEIGSGINWGINKTTAWATGGKDDSLGALVYELLHREKEPIKVEVSVQNGNIVAAVNDSAQRNARRH